MYVTAQKVESSRTGKSGTNVFIYLHGSHAPPALLRAEDIAATITTHPGKLDRADVVIAPGGNSVLSYLDVVAPDGTNAAQIAAALGGLAPDGYEGAWVVEYIAVRFQVHAGQRGAAQEFAGLRARLLEVLGHPQAGRRPTRPLVVMVGGEGRSLSFFLDEESGTRVEAAGGESAGITLSVARDTADDFEQAFGSIYRHVLPIVTRLELEQILWLGGVVFRGAESGRDLWRWPRPGVDVRPPLDMPSLQHVVNMARRPEAQATRADAIDLLKRELDQSSAKNPNLPTLARWLKELEDIR